MPETAGPPTARHRSLEHHRLVPQDTTVRFTTRHLFGLAGVTGSVQLLLGSVTVEAGELLSIEAELDMTTFESAGRARDRALASDRLLSVAAHPRATYRSIGVDRRDGGWLVHGELTVRGVPAPLDLLVDAPDTAAGGRVHATARVDRFDHGVTLPTALAARHLRIDITTRAARTTPQPAPVAAGVPAGPAPR